jgi:hypothetical protein
MTFPIDILPQERQRAIPATILPEARRGAELRS